MKKEKQKCELYDLCGENDIRFSPPCWSIKLCLLYKNVNFKTIPIRFSEKKKIEFSGQKLVPIIKYKDEVISDSWNIVCWLDQTFKEKPLLINEQNKSLSYFLFYWTQRQLQPVLFQIIANDILKILNEQDQIYFIKTREKRLGKPLSSLIKNREHFAENYRKLITPAKKILLQSNFLNGKSPGLSDFILFGVFMWSEKCSKFKIFEENDPLINWYKSLKEIFLIN